MLAPVLLATGLVVIAAGQDKPENSQRSKAQTQDRTKQADAWVDKFLKQKSPPNNVPRWSEVFEALEKRYGEGKLPCGTFDSARQKYFQEFMMPWAAKEGYNIENVRQQFIKMTDLPTTWTLSGRKRKGCLED